MKILITGNRGFIGSHAEREFRKLGHEVTTYEWDPNQLPRIEGVDWVLHFGAISSTTERDVAKVMQQNTDFCIWLYNECSKYDVNLQWSSSASVYGLGTDFTESAPVDPRSPYAWSKYLFEHYVSRNRSQIKCQGFRYFNVYGDNERHKGSQASPYHQFTLQAQTSSAIKVFVGSENFKRDFIPVEQVIDTHIQFLNVEDSGIWNVGTGQTKSFMDIAIEIAEKYRVGITTIPFPKHLEYSYQKYTCADLTKLHKTLNVL